MKVGVALADVLAGKDAAIAILAALVRRGRTGLGGRLSISLVDSARAALVNVAQNCARHGSRRATMGKRASEPRSISDVSRGRSAASSSPSAATRSGSPASRARARLALPTILRCATNAGRLAQRERIVAAFAERLATQPAAHWGGVLRRAAASRTAWFKRFSRRCAKRNASALTGVPPSVPGRVRFEPPASMSKADMIRRRWRGACSKTLQPRRASTPSLRTAEA